MENILSSLLSSLSSKLNSSCNEVQLNNNLYDGITDKVLYATIASWAQTLP